MDCGKSWGIVHARRALVLVRINPNHHAAQEQRNVGRPHLIDKALRVLGTGELLLKVRKTKTRVNALAEDSAQMLLTFNDGHARAGFMRDKRGRHAGGAAADNDHVERLCLHCPGSSCFRASVARIKCRHLSAPPSAVPRPAKIRYPLTAPRWGRSPARALGLPSRGSGKSHFGTDPCRHGSGA